MSNHNYHMIKKSGNISDVGDLKIFGFRVNIRHPGRRRNKMDDNVKRGFSLDIQPPPLRYRWVLPSNCPVFTVVMVIYHYIERIWIILVAPHFLYNMYNHEKLSR